MALFLPGSVLQRSRRLPASSISATFPTSISSAALIALTDVLLLFGDEFFEAFRGHDFDGGAHRRVGLAREGGGLAPMNSPSASARKAIVACSCRGPRRPSAPRSGTFQVWITSVEASPQLDLGVGRDHQLVVAEGAVRVVVAPDPLLPGRLDHQRAFRAFPRGRRSARPRWSSACRGGVGGEDDAEHEDEGRRSLRASRRRATGGRDRAAPLGRDALPRLAAVAADRPEQAEVDREDDDQRRR